MVSLQPLVNRYVREANRLFPTRSTELGIHDHDHELESFSKDGRQEILNFIQRFSKALQDFDPKMLSFGDYNDYALMKVELAGYTLNLEALKIWETDPNFYLDIIQDSSYYLIGRDFPSWEERAYALRSRMSHFPRFLQEAKENLKKPPKIFVENAMETVDGTIQFFKECDVKNFPVSKKLKIDLEKEKAKTLEALKDFAIWLKSNLLPSANGQFAIGETLFNRLLKEVYLLPYSAEDLLAIGEEHREKTLSEMKTVAQSIDPGKPWKEILAESARQHPPAEQLVAEYRKATEKAKEFVADKGLAPLPPHDKIAVEETPAFNRLFMPFAAYMASAAFEKKAHGKFWVTPVPPGLSSRETSLRLKQHAYHIIPLITVHETYPGHHLQASSLRGVSSPLVKRSQDWVSVEGWGLYCEHLMKEEGFYRNPITPLSQLKDLLWRIVRITLDVGLHTQGMTPKKAVAALIKTIRFPESMAWGEVKRYMRMPTQPMSYFIGRLEILRLREAYRRKRKEKFKLFDFHREFLNCGSIPLKLTEEKLLSGP